MRCGIILQAFIINYLPFRLILDEEYLIFALKNWFSTFLPLQHLQQPIFNLSIPNHPHNSPFIVIDCSPLNPIFVLHFLFGLGYKTIEVHPSLIFYSHLSSYSILVPEDMAFEGFKFFIIFFIITMKLLARYPLPLS